MIKAVLFDLDNTLILKKPTISEKVFELAAQDQPALRFETVQQAYAASELWQGEQIKKENETGIRMSDEEYLDNLVNIYRQHVAFREDILPELQNVLMQKYEKQYALAPYAEEVLACLKGKGMKLGIVSNNYSKIRQVLADLELIDPFDGIVISEEVELYKPDPKILEYACVRLGVPCSDSIYVGDHPFDILCAHSAGMPVVWMPENSFMTIPQYIGDPEYQISSLSELMSIFQHQ